MNPQGELKDLLKFIEAIERGKEKHPCSIYSIADWWDDVIEEFRESEEAYEAIRSLSVPDGIKKLQEEIRDLSVVAHRFDQFLGRLINSMENKL